MSGRVLFQSRQFFENWEKRFPKAKEEHENMSAAANLSAVTPALPATPSIATTTANASPNWIDQTAEESLSDLQCR